MILDTADPEVIELCPLNEILIAVPTVKILRLDPQREQVQVVTSEEKVVGQVQELVDMIMDYTTKVVGEALRYEIDAFFLMDDRGQRGRTPDFPENVA